MSTAEASARGRSNRTKGATAERDVAKWLRPWFPDACRAVRNTYPDPGDVDCTSPGLFWSVKNTQVESTNAWMGELNRKCGMRLGILVVKRKGHASPGEWWAWLTLRDLRVLMGFDDSGRSVAWESSLDEPCRMELGALMPLLVAENYAPTPKAAA